VSAPNPSSSTTVVASSVAQTGTTTDSAAYNKAILASLAKLQALLLLPQTHLPTRLIQYLRRLLLHLLQLLRQLQSQPFNNQELQVLNQPNNQ
jgi:hypothetical protein